MQQKITQIAIPQLTRLQNTKKRNLKEILKHSKNKVEKEKSKPLFRASVRNFNILA